MKRILCYGDSNTWGYQPAKPFTRYPKEVRWTGILGSLLGDEFEIIEEGLNGRTTVWDDPFGDHKNGKTYLPPCLESHAELDLVIIMLGTNDLKSHFSLAPSDIAQGLKVLGMIVKSSKVGCDGAAPELLLVSPTTIGELDLLAGVYEGAQEKSKLIARQVELIAQLFDFHFLDASKIVHSSPVDGVHWDEDQHLVFAQVISKEIISII